MEKALIISDLVEKIHLHNSKVEQFENTKEFCKIIFEGEDGSEREYIFEFKDKKYITPIRDFIKKMLIKETNLLKNELEKLS